MATYKLDTYIAEAQVDPFVLEISDTESITINAPTAAVLVEITEIPLNQTRDIFWLLCGEDQFDRVWEAVRDLPSSVLQGLMVDLLKHFNIGAEIRDLPGGSRASRRSSRSMARQ